MTNTTSTAEAPPARYTVFAGDRSLGSGDLPRVARLAKEAVDSGIEKSVLVFSDADGDSVEIDYRGSVDDVLRRLPVAAKTEEPESAPAAQGPGRPRLGVVAREVTLLPRHWDWLNRQPGGASVALRKLVEDARRDSSGRDRIRQAQEACYRFMSTMAGDLPGYEEANRVLFAGDRNRFNEMVRVWPADIAEYAANLADGALR